MASLSNDPVDPPVDMSGCLFVEDLHPIASKHDLLETFSPFGEITSAQVFTDIATGDSIRCGYVNFARASDAEEAMDTLMFHHLFGRPMRIMLFEHDPSVHRSGNLYIKGLAKDVQSKTLHSMFSICGEILSCKVASDRMGSMGYGYVRFKTMKAAENAISILDGMMLKDKKISITHYKTYATLNYRLCERMYGKTEWYHDVQRGPSFSHVFSGLLKRAKALFTIRRNYKLLI